MIKENKNYLNHTEDSKSTVLYTITNNWFYLLLFVFSMIIPHYFQSIYWIFSLFNILRIIFTVITFYELILYVRENRKIPVFIIVLGIYALINGIRSLPDSDSILETISLYFKLPTCVFCAKFEIQLNRNKKQLFEVLSKYFEIVIIINALTVSLFYFDGLDEFIKNIYFLGLDNSNGIFFLLGYLCLYINNVYHENKYDKRLLIYSLICIYQIIVCRVATTLVGFVAFALCMALININKINKLLNPIVYYVFYVFGFMMLVFIKIQEKLAFVFEGLFGKDGTLNGRSPTWDETIIKISKSPIFGYGEKKAYVQVIGPIGEMVDLDAHNVLLQEMLKGGLLLTMVHFIFVIKSIIELFKTRDNKMSIITAICFFTFLVMSLAETQHFTLMMLLYMICFEIKTITENDVIIENKM